MKVIGGILTEFIFFYHSGFTSLFLVWQHPKILLKGLVITLNNILKTEAVFRAFNKLFNFPSLFYKESLKKSGAAYRKFV